MEELKERFKKFAGKVFDDLGVLVDEFDFEFSGAINELYREITQKKSILKKFEEVDFILEVPLKDLGKIPYKSLILFSSCDYTENVLAIYVRYKLKKGIFVEDPEMTGYRTFEAFEENLENPLVWMKFGFDKSPYLSDSFVKKYTSQGCGHYRAPLDYHYETLSCQCINLKLSFKNLNVLI
jgi:hypothetical protein